MISASRLWRLASVLGVPITYFFEGLPPGLRATGPEEPAQPDQPPAVRGNSPRP